MALKQTRRSISINRKLYDAAKAYVHSKGESLAQFTEAALLDKLPAEIRPPQDVTAEQALAKIASGELSAEDAQKLAADALAAAG